MKRTTLLVLSAIALMALAAQSAQAATILYAADFNSSIAGHTSPFNTPALNYANGELAGQGTWLVANSGTNLAVAGNDTDGNVSMLDSGMDYRAQISPTITVAPGDKYYLSADITVSAAGATGDYFFNMGDGGASNFDGKFFAKSSGAGYVLGASVNTNVAGASFGSTVLSFGDKHHIVMEYDCISGTGNDMVEVYVDPSDPIVGGGATYVTANGTANDLATLGGVYLRQGTAGNGPKLVIDNIALASVPEPATFVLGGLGLVGLIGLARRKFV